MRYIRIKKTGQGLVFGLLTQLMLIGVSYADGSTVSGPTVSGFVDTSYITSFKKPLSGTIFSRSFDAQDNNITNTAQVAINGTQGPVGYVVKLLGGSDARPISLAEGTQSSFDIEEAYFTTKFPGSNFGLKVGKMVTMMGIEVVESKDNPNISKGYLFNFAECTTHTGGLVTYSKGILDIALGGVNGWDVIPDNNTGKTAIGKVSLNFGNPLFVQLSGMSGSEQASRQAVDNPATAFDETANNNGHTRTSLDLTGVTKIIPNLALNFQGNWGQERKAVDINADGDLDLATWKGVGVQPVYSITSKFSVGGRVEYFEDPQGARTGTVGFIGTNYALTPAYKLADNLTVRAEYRYDRANKKVWQDDKGVAKDTSSTASAEFIVTF